MTESTIVPVVGEGATVVYPQDLYPVVITRVSESGKTFWALPLKSVSRATGHEPDRHEGPWPVWDHTYTPEELVSLAYGPEEYRGAEVRVTLTKDGWKSRGTRYRVGKARYLRNFSY